MVMDWIIENWLLSAGIVLLAVYAIGDQVKKMNMKKQQEEENKAIIAEQVYKQQQENKEGDETEEEYDDETYSLETTDKAPFQTRFTNGKDKKKNHSTTEDSLKEYSENIKNSQKEMEEKIKKEKEQIQKELTETRRRREDLKKQGVALAELYDKVLERENQLESLLRK